MAAGSGSFSGNDTWLFCRDFSKAVQYPVGFASPLTEKKAEPLSNSLSTSLFAAWHISTYPGSFEKVSVPPHAFGLLTKSIRSFGQAAVCHENQWGFKS